MPRSSNNFTDAGFLEAALEGLLLQKQRIEMQITEVRSLLGKRRGRPAKAEMAAATKPPSVRRPLSESARKRIATAQKKRWAEYRKNHRSAE
jgi:hypothetical protein